MASFSREFAVIDTRLEYLELTRAGAMEVFAVDPAELASVHGVPVPEHGAFVGRVLLSLIHIGRCRRRLRCRSRWAAYH